MVRNFKEFKRGNWYIYTGSERGDSWNDKMMDFVLDHKPVQCLSMLKPDSAEFNINNMWNWADGFDNWVEIKDPNKTHQTEKGEYLYDKNNNTISIADQNYLCSGHPFYVLTNPPLHIEEKELYLLRERILKDNRITLTQNESNEISDVFIKHTKVKELLI